MKYYILTTILMGALFSNADNSEVRDEASQDLIKLLVDIDPKAYGYRAASHGMSVTLNADPVINGRLSLDYQLRLTEYLTMVFPVSFDSNKLAITQFNFNNRVDTQWSLLLGGGVKYRLCEWMAKSSFFVEFWAQMGPYAQQAKGFNDTRYAIRIRPSLYAGWERIFETGLVLGLKAGVEYNWDIGVGQEIAYSENKFSFIPTINVGYAW